MRAVAVDATQVLASSESQSAAQVPTHRSLCHHRRADDAGAAGRQLPYDVPGRVAGTGHVVANKHELIVVDARIQQRLNDASREGGRGAARAVAKHDNGELRAHWRSTIYWSNSARCRGVNGRSTIQPAGRSPASAAS